MGNSKAKSSKWEPQVTFDLGKGNASQFRDTISDFYSWVEGQKVDLLRLPDGWHTITPEMAERLLMQNASNREVSLTYVAYYAQQMEDGDWPATGQPVILRSDGTLGDGQHRLWACLLSGVAFTTFVVNQREVIPHAFAYMDNNKSRSGKDGLKTAGLNGQSAVVDSAVVMAMHYDADRYRADAKHTLKKISPMMKIRYVEAHPELQEAAHVMAGEHKAAASLIHHRDVAAFTAYKILTLWDADVLDAFMVALASTKEDLEKGDPIGVLQEVLKRDDVSDEPMKPYQVLGVVIKGFLAWKVGAKVKRISLEVGRDFPKFETGLEVAEAAE